MHTNCLGATAATCLFLPPPRADHRHLPCVCARSALRFRFRLRFAGTSRRCRAGPSSRTTPGPSLTSSHRHARPSTSPGAPLAKVPRRRQSTSCWDHMTGQSQAALAHGASGATGTRRRRPPGTPSPYRNTARWRSRVPHREGGGGHTCPRPARLPPRPRSTQQEARRLVAP